MPVLAIETPDGALRVSLELPARVRLGALVAAFFPVDDRATELAVSRSLLEGRPITCRVECAHCCRQLVPLSAPEAFHLASIVERRPDFADVERRFAGVHDALERSWIGYALRHRLAEDNHRATELAVAWHKFGHACPLLVNERCTSYADRPIVCREYLVTTPVEACARPGTAPLRRVPIALLLSEALAVVAGARLGAEFAGTVPLPSALAFASAHAEAAARTFASDELVADVIGALRR